MRLNREHVTDALRFWEIARIPYNLVLAGITGAAAIDSHAQFTPDHLMALVIWAVLANVAYCFAYVPDLFVQYSDFRPQRAYWRAALWLIGTAFAGCIAWAAAWSLFYSAPGAF